MRSTEEVDHGSLDGDGDGPPPPIRRQRPDQGEDVWQPTDRPGVERNARTGQLRTNIKPPMP